MPEIEIDRTEFQRRIRLAADKYRRLMTGASQGRPPCRFLATELAMRTARAVLDESDLPVVASTSTAVRLIGAARGSDDCPELQVVIMNEAYGLAIHNA